MRKWSDSRAPYFSPVIFNGTGQIPPATAINYVPWAWVIDSSSRFFPCWLTYADCTCVGSLVLSSITWSEGVTFLGGPSTTVNPFPWSSPRFQIDMSGRCTVSGPWLRSGSFDSRDFLLVCRCFTFLWSSSFTLSASLQYPMNGAVRTPMF